MFFRKRSGCAIFGTCALIRSNTVKKFISIHLDQSQKQARGLKFWLEMKDDLFYPSSENKGVGQLSSYRTADLRLCFRLRILVVCSGSFSNYLKSLSAG